MNIEKMNKQIIEHEGLRLRPYKCTAGKLSIGVGHNLDDVGITKKQAMDILRDDLDDCVKDLTIIFPNHFCDMPDALQRVLVDMRFNLGPSRFRKFKKMIRAVKSDDLNGMIREMRNSRWYRQVTNRANDLIKMIEEFC